MESNAPASSPRGCGVALRKPVNIAHRNYLKNTLSLICQPYSRPIFASFRLEGLRFRFQAYCLQTLNAPTIWLSKASAVQAVHCVSNLQERYRQKSRKSTNIQLGILAIKFFETFSKMFSKYEKFSSLESWPRTFKSRSRKLRSRLSYCCLQLHIFNLGEDNTLKEKLG